MRRKGDAKAEKALLAEIYKLLGNSAYGKFIEAVERQTRVLYTKDEDEVDKHLRSAYFEDHEEIGDAYKIESRQKEVTINRPFQASWYISWPNCNCYSSTTTSWTTTLISETTSLSRWTRIVCTSHFRTTLWKKQ